MNIKQCKQETMQIFSLLMCSLDLISEFLPTLYDGRVWKQKCTGFFLRLEQSDSSYIQFKKTPQTLKKPINKNKEIVVPFIILLVVVFCQHVCSVTKYNIIT